jgi:hypothetical protein
MSSDRRKGGGDKRAADDTRRPMNFDRVDGLLFLPASPSAGPFPGQLASQLLTVSCLSLLVAPVDTRAQRRQGVFSRSFYYAQVENCFHFD